MLTKLMAMGPMFGIAAFTWGADISVVDQPDWRPASEAQREALHLKAESHLIDYSFCTSGGVGMIVKAPAKPNKQYVEDVGRGYIDGTKEHGWTIVSQGPGAVGKLKGVCLVSNGEAKGRPTGTVTYMVFSNRDMYTVSVSGPAGLSANDPVVERYLARIQIAPELVPGDIESDSPYEQGRQFGKRWGGIIFLAGLAVFLVVVITIVVVVLLIRRRNGKPPPLPKNANSL